MDPAAKPSTALVRKRDDLELMPPPPAPKRIKRPKKVIDEDSYTDALSHIIARDFFPGLLESETQQEYLDALESKDPAWISSASKRLQHVMTPGRKRSRRGTSLAPGAQTPRGGFAGDTPVSVVSAATTAADEKPDIDTNMSLSAFQSKYTSEDNESFYKLLDKQNTKRAEKYAWLWTGNKLPSKQQLKQKEIETRLLESGKSLDDDGFSKRDRLAIKAKDDDARPAQPDTWKSLPNNALMFAPDGVSDSGLETIVQCAEAESHAAPKGVNYQNTRLPDPVQEQIVNDHHQQQQSVPPSPSLSAIRDAIEGRRRPGISSSSAASTTIAGSETPRVNGYAFVEEDDPEPEPGPDPSSALKIDLGRGDATPNPFIIKQQSRREALHHRMVDRISESKRLSSRLGITGKIAADNSNSNSGVGSGRTPVPKFPSSPRVTGGNLTPAAQRLWSQIGAAGAGGKTPWTPFGGGSSRTPVRTPIGVVRGSSKLKQVSQR
ncbi:nuclear protein DGCR14 [Xylariaceae sp. FL0255]|nr:nuclear protein DGCR14 [Xylariaceae sp. FL0255]